MNIKEKIELYEKSIYNFRFACYCLSINSTPEIETQKIGHCGGFVLFANEIINKYKLDYPDKYSNDNISDHDHFDEYLKNWLINKMGNDNE